MSKNIDINFTWSEELALKASKLYYNYDMKNSSKRYIGWLFIAMMQFGVVGALKHNVFGLLFVSTFLVLYWYYGRWYVRKGMIKKFYHKSGIHNQDVHFRLNSDEGLYHNDDLISWDNISKVVKFDDGILIQTTDITLFFESSAFKNFQVQQAFMDIMKEKGKV